MYRRAVELNPGYISVPFDLGILLAGQGNHGEAEAMYRKAIAIGSGNACAQNPLGILLEYKAKDLAGAEAAYREVIRANPEYVKAHQNLGGVLRAKDGTEGMELA
jgi:tetratricopeptide (TPR) repeat protein